MHYDIIKKDDYEKAAQMEAFVKAHPKSHFLQLPSWAKVKTAWDWRGILAWEGGELVGTFSVLVRPLPLGFSLLYGPRGPVCDRGDRRVMETLLQGADAVAKEEKALELLTDPDELDSNASFRAFMTAHRFQERENDGFDNIQAQHVFRLHLTGHTEESVFAGFCQKTRYNIRLAVRKGVTVRQYPGGMPIPQGEWDALQDIMEQTGARDQFIPRQQDYYQRVFSAFGREAVLFMAYLGNTPIAGTIGVFSGGKGWYLYGASSDSHRNVMPNYLLQWQMVQTALERACVFYDFRGVPGELAESNPLYGLYRFKKGFGGTYTKFTGLFVHRYRPLLGWGFQIALELYRKIRARICLGKMPMIHWERGENLVHIFWKNVLTSCTKCGTILHANRPDLKKS